MGGHHPFAKDPWLCSKNTSLPGCNSCVVASEHPGCYDATCANRVCDSLGASKCCEEAWDRDCALSAELFCVTEITPMSTNDDDENNEGYCPKGYVCDVRSNLMATCSELRQVVIDAQLGDIVGGIFCPDRRSDVLNCPPGHYCPTPTKKIRCPAGMFCPTKTVRPWIPCSSCGVAATEIPRRDFQFGCYVLIFVISLLPLTSWVLRHITRFRCSRNRHPANALRATLSDFGSNPRISSASPNKRDSIIDEESPTEVSEGIDICFRNLCLEVQVDTDESVNVIDNLSGRIRSKTMTALIGASGAGKTSLLNALCGRAFYGDVKGEIYVNGRPLELEAIKDIVGFVQQDDISYTELTVRENLIYSGRFRLPKGTTATEIEKLADSVMSNLGLSKVANQIVGDVYRRGVSGGEKKRVCVGTELMGRPVCLFLDEPTSGLDASSALQVMQSLRRLVENQGVTIVSSIHQPRKVIFDLFDSLVVLGVGGRMVYHGPNRNVTNYMESIGYRLPPGESMADFLIDISSGRLRPDLNHAVRTSLISSADDLNNIDQNNEANEEGVEVDTAIEGHEVDELAPLCSADTRRDGAFLLEASIRRENVGDEDQVVRQRRECLYAQWMRYCDTLDKKSRQIYDPPPPSKIPAAPAKQPFTTQLLHQLTRGLLVCWRSRVTMLLDYGVMFGATIVIAVTCGTPMPWIRIHGSAPNPSIVLSDITDPTEDTMRDFVRELFKHANTMEWETPVKIGVFLSVMTGLQATKILTSKRLNFFTEASSGYNISAYFVATDVVATMVFSCQLLLVAVCTAYIRQPLVSWKSYCVHFLVLGWICTSWALLVPMMVPKDNVSVVIGCCMCISGLLLSGTIHPFMFRRIYECWWTERIAGWVSPTRFFVEALTVGEYRCMPPQNGYTVDDESIFFDRTWTLMHAKGLARHDPNATQMDCGGWYWNVWPCFFIGLTFRFMAFLAMHGCNRAQQTKKPLVVEIGRSTTFARATLCSLAVLFLLTWFTTWLFTRDLDANYEVIDYHDAMKELQNGVEDLFNENSTLSPAFLPYGSGQ